MNSTFARRSSGFALFMMLVTLVRPARGAEIVITVTGTVNGVEDYLHVFGNGRPIPLGTPYTLVFTFDDTKGKPFGGGPCSEAGSGITGSQQNSPGTAVLTINGKSYEFGRRPGARSNIWRSLRSSCSRSEIALTIEEGQDPLVMGVKIKIHPNPGQQPVTQDKEWRSPLSISNFEALNGDNAFVITHPGDYVASTSSYLSVSSMTISKR